LEPAARIKATVLKLKLASSVDSASTYPTLRTRELESIAAEAIEEVEQFTGGSDTDLQLNDIAWQLYVGRIRLEKALEFAIRSTAVARHEANVQTLAAIYVRIGKWEEAGPIISEYLRMADEVRFWSAWKSEDVILFRDAIQWGRGTDLAVIVEQGGRESLKPLAVALRRLESPDSVIPPEMNVRVNELITDLKQ
jgi:hypothetical protein